MIAEGQHISFKNVVSNFYQFNSDEASKVMKDFTQLIESSGLTPNGPLFYTIQSDLGKEPIVAILSMPVKEERLANSENSELNLQTYFFIDKMIMKRVKVATQEEGQIKGSEATQKLLNYIVSNRMSITSQFYYMFRTVNDHLFLEVYLGATRYIEKKESKKPMSFLKKIKNRLSKGG